LSWEGLSDASVRVAIVLDDGVKHLFVICVKLAVMIEESVFMTGNISIYPVRALAPDEK
jgi:hypothetical protein